MIAYPKYYRADRSSSPVCLRREADALATVVHIPYPNERWPLAVYLLKDNTSAELDELCGAMVETTAGKFEDFLIAFFSQAKSNAAELHTSRQQRFESGQLKL